MMGQPVTVAASISPGEYYWLLGGWQKAHMTEEDLVEAPDPEWWEAQQERIRSIPHLTGVEA